MRVALIGALLLLAISCRDPSESFEVSNESATETVVLVGRDSNGEVVELAILESGDRYYEPRDDDGCLHDDLAFETPGGEFIGTNPDPQCVNDGWVYADEPDGEIIP
jgi:hypothetical protein